MRRTKEIQSRNMERRTPPALSRSASWRVLRAVLAVGVILVVGVVTTSCTPALVDFLPAHTFRVVNAETGEPIPGAAMLLTWGVCSAFSGSRTVKAWGGTADSQGIIRVPVRTVFGNYYITEMECDETVHFFKSGGWKGVTDRRSLGGLKYGKWSFVKDKDGINVVRMEPIPKDDRENRIRALHFVDFSESHNFRAAYAPLEAEGDEERAQLASQ